MKTEVLRGRNLVHYSSVDSERHRMEALSVLHHEKIYNYTYRNESSAGSSVAYPLGTAFS